MRRGSRANRSSFYMRGAVSLAVASSLIVPAVLTVFAGPAGATAGQITTIVGTGVAGYNGDGIAATSAQLDSPTGVATDSLGNTIVADASNERIRVFAHSPQNGFGYPLSGCAGSCVWAPGNVYTIAGTGTAGYNGDGIVATAAEVDAPTGVALDAAGNIVFTDYYNSLVRVIAVSNSTPAYTLAGCGGSCTWVPGHVFTIGGTNVAGYTGDGISAVAANLDGPQGVAIDLQGNVVFTDSIDNRVRVIAVGVANPGYPLAGCVATCTWTAGDIFTVAGDGTSGYTGDGVLATLAPVSAPAGVKIDSTGNLLISDTFNRRIRVVNVSGANPGYLLAGCAGACTWTYDNIYTIAGDGTYGYTGDGIAATSAELELAFGITTDSSDNVLYADRDVSRIRVVAVSASNPGYQLGGCAGTCTWTSGNIYTVAGNGTTGYNGEGIAATAAALGSPSAVAVNNAGGLVVADEGDSRVRVVVTDPFNVPPSTAPVSSTVTAGEDAVWTVPIQNATGSALQGLSATLHAGANGFNNPLTFDDANMPGCAPGAGNSEVCSLPDVPAHSVQQFKVFVSTAGLSVNDTISGDIDVTTSTFEEASGVLGTVTVVSCGAQCVMGVVAPGVPVSSPAPTSAEPTQQLVTLPSNDPNQPALAVTLQSIDPAAATAPSAHRLCPIAPNTTHCSGQISSVVAQFAKYNDPAHPIRVTVVALWGSAVPAGRMLMEKATGGDPLFLLGCVRDSTTNRWNTPCVLPQTVTGTSAGGDLTTHTTILFTGLDIQFARRTASGGTIISPPAAPTAVSANPGSLKAVLTWKAPTVTNGAGVTSYVVSAIVAGKVVKTITYSSPALTQTFSGLVNGTAYTFKVAAGNVAGVGPQSTSSASIVVGAPARPAKPIVTKVASGSLRVTFTAPANNGAAITKYTVACTSSNSGVAGTKTGTASPITVTALTAGKTYSCTVKATNSRGTGPASASSTAVTA
jgi:hypothetical protein